MKSRKPRHPVEARPGARSAAAPERKLPAAWHLAAGFALALAAAFVIYSPAVNGTFVFDDRYLPFMNPAAANFPLRAWIGVRPLLGLTYLLSYRMSGLEPFAYHSFNIVLHALNSVLVFVVVRKFLEFAGETGRRREMLAAVTGVIFLAHPVQTEAVAYIASRSETLSVCFALASFALFLYSREDDEMKPLRAAAILVLFVAAVTTKEHTLALPLVFAATDLLFGGTAALKRNRVLHAGFILGAAVGVVLVWNILKTSPMIGFNAQNLNWYQYLFTQFRAVVIYLRLYLLPVGLNADYDMPPSLTIVDHLAFVWLALLISLLYLAWRHRKQYPLAAYGFVAFLILLGPTSSIVPIRDVIAERRLYLPMIGLLLITVDLLRRPHWFGMQYAALGAALLVGLGGAAYARNRVWSDSLALWQDTVEKSPAKRRPRLQLARARMDAGECLAAAGDYEAASRMGAPDYELLYNWAYALDCAGQPAEGAGKLRQAAKLEQTAAVYASLGMMLGKQQHNQEALDALAKAVAVNPNFAMTYVYRGNVYMQLGDAARGLEEFRAALARDPSNETARQSVAMAERRLQQTGH